MAKIRKKDTGEKGNRGEFGSVTRQDAKVAVEEPSDPPLHDHRADRDEILAKYQVEPEDLPGFVTAWDERFAVLDEPAPLTPATVCDEVIDGHPLGRLRGGPTLETARQAADRDSLFDPSAHGLADDDLVVEIYTRNGGGNREHYDEDDDDPSSTASVMESFPQHPNYITDWDDDFDSTYATILLRVPDSHVKRAIRATSDTPSQELEHRQSRALQEIRAMRRGETAPWSILAEEEAVSAKNLELRNARRNAMDTWERDRIETEMAAERSIVNAMDAGESVPEFPGTVQVTTDRGQSTRVGHANVQRSINTVRSAEAELERMQRLHTSAENVADPELREWLIGERPEQSYNATEGRGRSKRTVRKTYRPKPELLEKLESARRADKIADGARTELQSIRDHLESHRDRMAADRAARQNVARIDAELWGLGWNGEGETPQRPVSHVDAPWR